MKLTSNDYIKIALTIAIIAGMFMPYAFGIIPIDVLFEDLTNLEALFGLTIPVLITIPFLLILIFKRSFSNSKLKLLNVIFLILFILVLVDYGYGIYNSYNSWIFDESFEFLIAMLFGLILLLLNLKYSISKSEQLQTTLLAIIGLPITLYFAFGLTTNFREINYGGYIIFGSFISLYIMAVYNIYINRKSNQLK